MRVRNVLILTLTALMISGTTSAVSVSENREEIEEALEKFLNEYGESDIFGLT